MIKLEYNNIAVIDHFKQVEQSLITKIKNIIKRGSITRDGVRITLTSPLRTYLRSLLLPDALKNLIILTPTALRQEIARIKRLYPNFIVPKSPDNLILRAVFVDVAYEKELDKHLFISRLELDVCPYCNRSYIYVIDKKDKIKPQIDHFYPKSKYPFLGLSYYNLIPSCQTCNGFGAKEEYDPLTIGGELVNPYLLTHSAFKFTYKINSIDVLNPLKDKKSVDVILKTPFTGHLKVFKLDKLYELHSDHVLELVIKSKVIYADAYRRYLSRYIGLNFSSDDIDRLILGNYAKADEVHKRPLAKLYQDIAKELKLI